MDRAGRWFLHSGIREPSGGVARYYSTDTKANCPISTEITGYTVSTLVRLARLSASREYMDAALESARFLTRRAWDRRLAAFPFEYSDGAAAPAPAYFFDCGIIVRGLLAVSAATVESEFLEIAREAGLAMARDFRGVDAIHPILSLQDKRPLAYGEGWSRNPGCYQLKSAMAWRDLADATGEAQFAGWYEEALAQALATHESFLPGPAGEDKVMDRLHAYCYFLEGLLPVAGRPECARVLEAGIARTGRHLRAIAPTFARSDVYAQLLRLRLYAVGIVPLEEDAAEEEAQALAEFQCTHEDPRIHGGFGFGRRGGAMLPFVNPVSTAFGIQALEMWRAWRAGVFEPAVASLI